MARTILSSFYTDPAGYESERRLVFGQEWVVLGPDDALARPGGYVADTVAGFPLFAVRDDVGALWAYHNVCPHRAGPLVDDGQGTVGGLRCLFHGWAFGWEGSLIDNNDFGELGDFVYGAHRLRPVPVGCWGGFVWVSLSVDLLPLPDELNALVTFELPTPLDAHAHAHELTQAVSCNWKLYADLQLEAYRTPSMQPELAAAVDLDQHRVDIMGDPMCVRSVPLRGGGHLIWLYVFPNLVIEYSPAGVVIQRINPVSVDETEVTFYFLTRDPAALGSLMERSRAQFQVDQKMCERVQLSLAAGDYVRGDLSPKHEQGLSWFQYRISAALGSEGFTLT